MTIGGAGFGSARQSWIEIARPMGMEKAMPTYIDPDIKLRVENANLRCEVDKLRTENEELRAEVLQSRRDKLVHHLLGPAASLTGEKA